MEEWALYFKAITLVQKYLYSLPKTVTLKWSRRKIRFATPFCQRWCKGGFTCSAVLEWR